MRQDQDHGRLPGGRLFRLRRATWKSRKSHHPQVTKGACSWFGSSFVGVPSLRSCSVDPPPSAIHGGGRLSRHPCRSAHCARPAFSLLPSRDWRCLGFLRMKIKSTSRSRAKADQEQKQIKGFPAEAGPTGCTALLLWDQLKQIPLGAPRCFYGDQLKPVSLGTRVAFSGTGFSREGAGRCALGCRVG